MSMTKADSLNDGDVKKAAWYYLNHGFKVIPIPRQGNHKNPARRNWQTHDAVLEDFGTNDNIGLRLGEEFAKGFLADTDVDMKMADGVTPFPGATEVADDLLPRSPIVWGRDSRPRGHRLVVTTAPIHTEKYYGLHDNVLIERRGLAPKKKSPQQTVIPPGEHETGELIRYVEFDDEEMKPITAEAFCKAVQYTAVALAILQIWPERGKRHDARLAFAKILLEAKMTPNNVECILTAVMRATGSNVEDVKPSVHDTAGKDPKDTVGASWIVKQIEQGAETLKVIDRILGIKRKPTVSADGFYVTEINLKTLTPAVWQRLADRNDPVHLCLQGGIPVRAVHIPENHKKRRPTWILQPLVVDRLRHETAQVAEFFENSGMQVVPPTDIIKDMLACPPCLVPLPSVTRITYAPTMADDGTIELEPGYHPATSTFYVPDPTLTIPTVADRPTEDDVKRAVDTLLEPIAEFDFVTDADRTHAIAVLLLPFVRSLIDGLTPLHLFLKPTAGSGATLLTDTLLFPAVGTDIAKITTVTEDDEWRKTITSTLLDGPSAIVIDNARELISPILAKALTDIVWQARILGVSRNALLQVECVWVATGNNPVLHTEIMRRIVPCHLDPGVEQPWLRDNFRIKDLRAWSREHRGNMICAALTLAKAWHVAGRKKGDRSLGMYEQWAHVVGGILKHAGFTDFLGNLEHLYEGSNVEGDAVKWLYEEWNVHHHSQPVKISDVAVWALVAGSPMMELLMSKTDRGLHTEFSTRVRQLKNRVVNALRIEQVKASGQSRHQTWRLVSVDGKSLPPAANSKHRDEIPF